MITMQNALLKRWDNESNIFSYDPVRKIFRSANEKIVNSTLGKYVKPEDKMIEIGSGLGEIVNLASNYKQQIQQTEQGENVVKKHKELYPDSNIIPLNIYYADKHLSNNVKPFDIALGYSSFDTLVNLNEAMRQVNGLLKDKGYFIHFLDLTASPNTLFQLNSSLYNSSDVVLFPLYEPDEDTNIMQSVGLQSVKNKDLPKLKQALDSLFDGKLISEDTAALLDNYTNQPEMTYVHLYNSAKDGQFVKSSDVLKLLSNAVFQTGINTEKFYFNESFKSRLENASKENGFNIIESANKRAESVEDLSNVPYDNKFKFYFNNVGIIQALPDYFNNSNLPDGKVNVTSILQVFVAQKCK